MFFNFTVEYQGVKGWSDVKIDETGLWSFGSEGVDFTPSLPTDHQPGKIAKNVPVKCPKTFKNGVFRI